jgi:putative hemolysin
VLQQETAIQTEPAAGNITLRLAETDRDIKAAQNLRYKVFYEENGALPTEDMKREARDFDAYDEYADHLLVIDESLPEESNRIVGTYRLIRKDRLNGALPFYTSSEFDIGKLQENGGKLLELGRSCVLPEYRTKAVVQLLWQGIADYLLTHDIDLMFGCASLFGTDPNEIADELSYLHHYHLAPDRLCPKAIAEHKVDLPLRDKDSLNAKRVFASLPPLLKGYLRLGGWVGNGAVIDHQFNTIDVCIVLPMSEVSSRYDKHYRREVEKSSSAADGAV